MKTKTIDLAWIDNLAGVGTPILDFRQSIESELSDAAKALEQAKQDYVDALESVRNRSARLEKKIQSLWTPNEIQAAKNGCYLINGEEVPRHE